MKMFLIDTSYQYAEEWEEEPESVKPGDTWIGPRSAFCVSSVDFRSMERGLHQVYYDFHLAEADQCISEARRITSSAWGDGLFNLTISPKMGRERPTANHEDQYEMFHRRYLQFIRMVKSMSAPVHLCNMFWTRSAAAVWIMMALTVATSSLAGAECIGTEVELDKGEAVLRCPLPVNASATRQGIIVKHFPTPDTAGEVMRCDWPTKEAGKPECKSRDGFSQVGQLTDHVVAKVPVSRLKDSGAYKCQLYPLGDHNYFTPCHIHHFSDNDEGKHSAVRPTPVVSSTATNGSTPGQDPLIREAPPCVGQSGSVALTAVVLVLQVVILLVVNVLYLENRKNLQGKDGCMKVGWMTWCPWNSSEKSSETSAAEPMNAPEV